MERQNLYGGGTNNGDWRFISETSPPVPPIILRDELAAIAGAGKVPENSQTAIADIKFDGSGILWGRLRSEVPKGSGIKAFFAKLKIKGNSYLEGPIRITANYIRLDGPIQNIGDDVELHANRIVIDGVDLPVLHWREELHKIAESSRQSQPQ